MSRAALALLALLYVAATPAAGTLIHSERSQYREVLVYEDAGTRCLCFTHGCAIGRQSCIELAHPDHMVFEYTRMMLGALFLNPDPHDILVIGLGGGTLPRALRQLLPAAHIDVAEIDPAVVRVAMGRSRVGSSVRRAIAARASAAAGMASSASAQRAATAGGTTRLMGP